MVACLVIPFETSCDASNDLMVCRHLPDTAGKARFKRMDGGLRGSYQCSATGYLSPRVDAAYFVSTIIFLELIDSS